MKKGLSATGMLVYGLVMVLTLAVDIVIQIHLFASGNIGGAILYLIIGWTITLTIGHWIGMIVAAPFLIAGAPRK